MTFEISPFLPFWKGYKESHINNVSQTHQMTCKIVKFTTIL